MTSPPTDILAELEAWITRKFFTNIDYGMVRGAVEEIRRLREWLVNEEATVKNVSRRSNIMERRASRWRALARKRREQVRQLDAELDRRPDPNLVYTLRRSIKHLETEVERREREHTSLLELAQSEALAWKENCDAHIQNALSLRAEIDARTAAVEALGNEATQQAIKAMDLKVECEQYRAELDRLIRTRNDDLAAEQAEHMNTCDKLKTAIRERDEARETIARTQRLADHHGSSCSMLAGQLVKTERERDEARRNEAKWKDYLETEKAGRLKAVAQRLELAKERDRARELLASTEAQANEHLQARLRAAAELERAHEVRDTMIEAVHDERAAVELLESVVCAANLELGWARAESPLRDNSKEPAAGEDALGSNLREISPLRDNSALSPPEDK